MKQTDAVRRFLKKNAVYFVLALCVLAIGLSITLVMLNRTGGVTEQAKVDYPQQSITEPTDTTPTDSMPTDSEPDVPVVKVISFIMPVANSTAIEDYTDTLAYNATLKRYEAHKAMDIFAEEGSAVYAAYDGVISDIQTTLLTGTTITIDHGDGLYSVYNSLSDGDSVFIGQAVSQGTKIGEVSVSNRQESADGAHLHFQVIENGAAINPAKYLSLDEK